MSIRKIIGMENNVEDFKVLVAPKSITIPKHSKSFRLYLEKGKTCSYFRHANNRKVRKWSKSITKIIILSLPSSPFRLISHHQSQSLQLYLESLYSKSWDHGINISRFSNFQHSKNHKIIPNGITWKITIDTDIFSVKNYYKNHDFIALGQNKKINEDV